MAAEINSLNTGQTLIPLFSREEIAETVRRLACEIDNDIQRRTLGDNNLRDQGPGQRALILVGVLKGAFVFLADLVREMQTPISAVEFLRISSYGAGTNSSGRAHVAVGLPPRFLMEQDVVLVEDIVDTGITTAAALRYLRRQRPHSLKLCSLLDKPSRRRVKVDIDYLGLTAPDRFVVGYGLDLDQRYRQLPDLYTLEQDGEQS
jgi:hypoxanthine phosphoribosyltransferase